MVWPTRKETLISTGMVFVMVILAALFFMFVDFVFSQLVGWVLPGR